jgi:type I restriction enzyme S subunit
LALYFDENRQNNSALETENALQFKFGEIIQKPKKNSELTDEDKALISRYTIVDKNDIVVNCLNLNYDLKSLRIGRVREHGIITSAYIVIRKRDKEDSSFFNYLLKAYDDQKVFHNMGTGIRLTLKFQELKTLLLPIPPLSERHTIVTFLDRKCGEIDELLDLETQMIDELKAYKQSIITEAVTRGLNPNVPMRNSGIEWIGEIPQHWTIENLTKIIWLRARLGWRGLKAEEYVESGYPFLSAFNIVDNKLIWSDLNYITQERYDESPEIKLSEGDVLIVKDGAGIGKCARVDSLPCGEATVNSSLGVITPSERLNYAYLHYFLLGSTFQNMVLFLKNGMGVPHLTQENMKSVKIQLPPLNEQQEIAKYLDSKCADIDALIALREEKIDTLKEYKKSLIFEYVTGKKQVV